MGRLVSGVERKPCALKQELGAVRDFQRLELVGVRARAVLYQIAIRVAAQTLTGGCQPLAETSAQDHDQAAPHGTTQTLSLKTCRN